MGLLVICTSNPSLVRPRASNERKPSQSLERRKTRRKMLRLGPKAPKKKRKPKQQQQQEQEQQQQQQQGGGDAIVPAPAESTATEAIEAPQSSGALPKTPLDGQIPQPPDAQPGQVAATIPPAPSHRLPLSRGQAVTSAPTQTQTAQGVDALQDVIGSSGVDLGAEEHAMGLQGAQASGEVRAAVYANSSSFLDPFTLSARVLQIAKKNDLQVEGAVLQYLSLATKSRVRSLVESMITASRHRTWSSHEREPSFWERKKSLEDGATPMYHQRIRTDPQKQLRALERVERTNEQAARRIRFERDEKEAAGTLDDDVEMADGGISREATKKRPLGAAAQAKNMSEDVRRRLANNTAARALGPAANTPKWMQMSAAVNASAAASPLANRTGSVSAEDKGSSADVSGTSTPGGLGALPRPRFAPQPSGILSQGSVKGSGLSGGLKKEWSGLAPHAHTGRVSVTGAVDGNIKSSGWADLAERQRAKEAEEKARARQVTMQDALHALEMEAPASLGRGSGRRALYRARAVGYATEHSRTDT
ncbi:hypothetical protein IE81DRAFT_84903 [Ceraceosorus guamensis]|uniref:Transcription initiation factor TFIID subunit 4 n=1 Tax=Ceraceosorus guamensis TaxID=1522189 RepID=A0A316W8F1_9BASI|nr:hypothetical protein IE81DRAFT_84903 [Ceraceosorus guamensis]PWN46149.1 hypothetical protein IE81DRAFT_84903 [Ceraceosorus guamensis]